jgi:hypothetical protein
MAGCALAAGERQLQPLAEHGLDVGRRATRDGSTRAVRSSEGLAIGERQIGIGRDEPLDGEEQLGPPVGSGPSPTRLRVRSPASPAR